MKLAWLALIPILFVSCRKTEVAYEGIVYSKHKHPLPGVEVVFTYKEDTQKKRSGSLHTYTGSDGKFTLHETIKRKIIMETVRVNHDSGYYESGLSNRKGISHLEIVLQ